MISSLRSLDLIKVNNVTSYALVVAHQTTLVFCILSSYCHAIVSIFDYDNEDDKAFSLCNMFPRK